MRLEYIEIEISEYCNLNCRSCSDCSNLSGEKAFYELEEYRKDLSRIAEIFSGIDKIRIMGGEPFLNPEIAEYVNTAKELFPGADLRIVTNGTLIPTTDMRILRELAKSGAFLDISAYPPTRTLKKAIKAKLKEAGLDYNFSPPINFFFKSILDQPVPEAEKAFYNCLFANCHMLGHGKLAPCSFAYCAYRLNREYGTQYPEDDFIDIYSDVSAEEIVSRFAKPHSFCGCCSPALVPKRWVGGITSDKARLSDWTVNRDSFFLKKMAVIQAVWKKPAMFIRKMLQKR